MHQSLISNLNHWFLKKTYPDCVIFFQYALVCKDKLDREALQGIFWVFSGGLITYGLFF
jgi:hypothetical protein